MQRIQKNARVSDGGFSSLECVIVLFILGVLISVTWPLFNTRNPWQQSQWLADQLTMAIHYARIEAVARGELLCLESEVHDAHLRLKLVSNSDNASQPKVLHQWDWDTASCQVQWHGFHQQGVLLSPDAYHVAANGYFLIHHGTEKMIKLVVNRWGKVHLERLRG